MALNQQSLVDGLVAPPDGMAVAVANTVGAATVNTVGTGLLPLCSFGPGGSYVVDWQIFGRETRGARVYPPRTLGSAVQRVAGQLLGDLAGWLLARHPARQYRMDSCPAALDPCLACGHSNRWPDWFVAGHRAVPWELVAVGTGPQVAQALPASVPAPDPQPEVVPAMKSTDLEPVHNLRQSPAGQLLLRLTYCDGPSSEDEVIHNDDRKFLNTEYSHDPHSQATQNFGGDSRLPGAARLLADDAGNRRPARHLQSNGVRARRGARSQRPAAAEPTQGTLFGSQPEGQAA